MALVAGCSLLHSKPAPLSPAGGSPAASSEKPPEAASQLGPEAKIHISYSRSNDFLSSLRVTQYSGADSLSTTANADGTASIVRFEGGVTVWQFDVEKGMFTTLPIGGSTANYAISEVEYGKMPAHFVQSIPENGPPDPLEPNHFYVFSVTRASSSISYEAVKVNGDGSLEAYVADPRAGTSFRLCCNLAADFTLTPPPSARPGDSPADSQGP